MADDRPEPAGAYWLLDEIARAQRFDKLIVAEEFQLWKLKVNSDHTATLVCEDGDCRSVFTKAIEYTDFPLAEISLYFINNTIVLAERILIGSVGLAAVTRPFALLRRAGAVEASKCGLDLKRNADSTQLMTEGHASDDFGWRRWRGARGSGR